MSVIVGTGIRCSWFGYDLVGRIHSGLLAFLAKGIGRRRFLG